MPNVSFMAPGSELELAQQDATRQRALADALRQQSMTPSQGIQAGQMYIAPSWTQGLAKMLQAYQARKVDERADEGLRAARTSYDTRTQSELADILAAYQGKPGTPATPEAQGNNPSAYVPEQAAQAATPPNAALAQALMLKSQNPMFQQAGMAQLSDAMGMQNKMDMLARARAQGGATAAPGAPVAPSGAAPTGMVAGGVPAPAQAAPQAPPQNAAPVFAGIDAVPTDATNFDMVFNGGKGIGGMIESANKPIATRQGVYRIGAGGRLVFDTESARGEGAIEEAKLGAQDAHTMVPVTNRDGTVTTMTRAQAIALANRNGEPAPAPARAPASAPVNAATDKDRFVSKDVQAARDKDASAILSSEIPKAEAQLAEAKAKGDPAAIERAQNDLAGIKREQARLPGFQSGQSTADHSFGQERGKSLAEYETKINADANGAQQKIVQNNKMISLVPEITTGPFSKQVTTLKMLTRNIGVDVGDPSSNQEFEKYAIKGALEGAKQIYGARLTNQDVMSQIMSNPGSNMAEKALYQLIKFDTEVHQRLLDKQAAYYDYTGPREQFEMRFNRDHPLMGIGAPKAGQSAKESAPSAPIPVLPTNTGSPLKPRPGGGFDYTGKK